MALALTDRRLLTLRISAPIETNAKANARGLAEAFGRAKAVVSAAWPGDSAPTTGRSTSQPRKPSSRRDEPRAAVNAGATRRSFEAALLLLRSPEGGGGAGVELLELRRAGAPRRLEAGGVPAGEASTGLVGAL
jgi:hypothetical protein